MYDPDGPEESALEISFDVSFVRASCLDYSARYPQGFLLLSPSSFITTAHFGGVLEGS